LWDIEAYFDSFSVSDIARLATRLRCPQRLLPLALQLHMSTRLLTCGGSTSALGAITEGVLAGDPQSMVFAKLATYELLAELHRAHAPAAPRAYVDDMAMMLVELAQAALLGALRLAVTTFVEELGKLRRFSPADARALHSLRRWLIRDESRLAAAEREKPFVLLRVPMESLHHYLLCRFGMVNLGLDRERGTVRLGM
jgi:hypothetical protein